MTNNIVLTSEAKSKSNGASPDPKHCPNNNNNNNNNNNEEKKNGKPPADESGKMSSPSQHRTESSSKEKWKSALSQALATCAKNMLLFSYGTTLGLPTIAIPYLSEADTRVADPYLSLPRAEISWFSSINLIMVPLGCLVSGAITQPFGRKRSMMFLNLPFILAFLLYHHSSHVGHLYLALAICGFFGGVLEAPVLTYVAEITQPHLRGMLSATASMTTIFGTVSQLFLGSFLHWRSAAILNLLFPILALCALCFIPESPHWLITKGRMREAEASLCWLRGWTTPDKVAAELSFISEAIHESSQRRLDKDGVRRANYRMYTRRNFLLPFFIVTCLFFMGQFGGMTALQTYAVSIFESIHAPFDPYFATLLLGLAELGGSLLCVILIYYTGKRPLSMVSTGGSAFCFFIVAVYIQFHVRNGWDSPLVPTVFLLLAAFLTHICIRLLPWMLIGEMFPNNIRATASGVSSSTSYVFASAVNKLYYPMIDSLHLWGTLYFYAAISLLGALYIYFCLPETETRSLADIEAHFADKRKTFVTQVARADKMRRREEKEREEKEKEREEKEKEEGRAYDNFALESGGEKYISRF